MQHNHPEGLAKSLGRIVSGVGVITCAQGEERSAMLSSWFQQASFEPPMITIAVQRDRPILAAIQKQKRFALNIFHDDQKDMVAHFGKGFAPGEDPFARIELRAHDSGLPILEENLGFLILELKQSVTAGDHELCIAQVVGGELQSDGKPMVHIRRNGFHY